MSNKLDVFSVAKQEAPARAAALTHPESNDPVLWAASVIAEIMSGGGISDIQIRTDRHIRVHGHHGIKALEQYGRISASMVQGFVLALYRSRGGGVGVSDDPEGEEEFFNRLRENGSEDFSAEGGDVLYSVLASGRLRVQVFFDLTGMALTARVLKDELMSLGDMTFEEAVMIRVKDMVEQKSGIGLITGQTGAGKSTTMAAIIAHLQTCGRHIVTVENPIEYRFPDVPGSLVTQQEVGTHVESFKRGLTDALRKRPHVIAIGEIRDKETLEIALEAAQTGHLVLSTLHTKSAPETLSRIVGLFEPSRAHSLLQQLSYSLRFIISQGLLPRASQPGSVLCYEAIFNTNAQSRAAIAKYCEAPKSLEEWMRTGDNRLWEKVLEALLHNGRITAATANENRHHYDEEH